MTDKPQPLPSEGGSYIRDEKGNLNPAPAPEKTTRKPDAKEG